MGSLLSVKKFLEKKMKKINWLMIGLYFFGFLSLTFLFMLLMVDYQNDYEYTQYMKKMFWNKDGFNWTSVTALAALMGLFITTRSNNKGIKANIISSERAKWLDNHKSNMANFLQTTREIQVLCNRTISMYKDSYIKQRNLNNIDKELSVEQSEYDANVLLINKKQQELIFLSNSLSLGLSEDSCENVDFIQQIDEVISTTEEYRVKIFSLQESPNVLIGLDLNKKIKEIDSNSNYSKSITELTKIAKAYYKNVWKEIKKGS